MRNFQPSSLTDGILIYIYIHIYIYIYIYIHTAGGVPLDITDYSWYVWICILKLLIIYLFMRIRLQGSSLTHALAIEYIHMLCIYLCVFIHLYNNIYIHTHTHEYANSYACYLVFARQIYHGRVLRSEGAVVLPKTWLRICGVCIGALVRITRMHVNVVSMCVCICIYIYIYIYIHTHTHIVNEL